MAKVTVLGNFSGRNAGDNAILGCVLEELSSQYPQLEFQIPTINASYVRHAFDRYRIKPVGLMPWNGSLKIFGIPTLRAMLASDLVLVTDAILFDRWFFDPTHNYLATIGLFAPLCKRAGIPVVLYNASLGPIATPRGARALQRILDAGPLTIVRDAQSVELLQRLGLRANGLALGADSALGTRVPAPTDVEGILGKLSLAGAGRPLFGFNVNSYVDTWQRSTGNRLSRSRFTAVMAESLDTLITRLGVEPICFVTQVMDRQIAKEVIGRMRHGARVRIVANPDYDYREISGVMSRLGLLLGMRTHSLILASAAGTPVVNVNVYPKSEAFLRTIGMQRWSIDFESLSVSRLVELVTKAWMEREQTRRRLLPAVNRERNAAAASATLIGPLLGLTPARHHSFVRGSGAKVHRLAPRPKAPNAQSRHDEQSAKPGDQPGNQQVAEADPQRGGKRLRSLHPGGRQHTGGACLESTQTVDGSRNQTDGDSEWHDENWRFKLHVNAESANGHSERSARKEIERYR